MISQAFEQHSRAPRFVTFHLARHFWWNFPSQASEAESLGSQISYLTFCHRSKTLKVETRRLHEDKHADVFSKGFVIGQPLPVPVRNIGLCLCFMWNALNPKTIWKCFRVEEHIGSKKWKQASRLYFLFGGCVRECCPIISDMYINLPY